MLTNKDKYYTVDRLFSGEPKSSNHKMEFLNATEGVWFLPSCVDFSFKNRLNNNLDESCWQTFNNTIEQMNFDVVIYDCQAGYSMVTEIVTKFSNKNLAVIEADAISASSLRVLYAQLSENLDRGNTYQVFNKITKEEQDVYSKLIHGTLFTNLTPILFDWNVRKAFVTNELPDIDASNPILTNSIYNLAFMLFPSYKKELREFLLGIKKEMLSKLEDDVHDVKKSVRRNFREKYVTIISSLISVSGSILAFFTFNLFDRTMDMFGYPYLIIFFGVLIAVSITTIMSLILKKSKNNDETRSLKKKQQLLEDEIADITKKISR